VAPRLAEVLCFSVHADSTKADTGRMQWQNIPMSPAEDLLARADYACGTAAELLGQCDKLRRAVRETARYAWRKQRTSGWSCAGPAFGDPKQLIQP
jgi:hypothetical protein